MQRPGPVVIARRIRLLYRLKPVVLAANIINSGIVCTALWSPALAPRLIAWGLLQGVLIAVRGMLWLRYRRSDPPTGRQIAWARYYALGSALSGMVWGSSALLFIMPDDPVALMLIVFVIAGMAAGAVTGLSCHLPAFHLYLLCSVSPLAVRLMLNGDRLSLAMSAMILVFVAGLVVIAHSANQALTRALMLSEENRHLLADRERVVAERTAELQAANALLLEEAAQRRRAQAEAESANQAKSRFLAAASHDLRQPVQSLFLFAHALHRHVGDPEGRSQLAMLERCLDTLKGLLDGLLDLSGLEVDALKPRITSFALQPLLEEIGIAYGATAADRGLVLRVDASGPLRVRSDRTLLGRILRNLVDNAVRYTERGEINVRCTIAGLLVRLDVSDTGIGIAPDEQERIFEEFRQIAPPEHAPRPGLGLGLAIVRQLASRLGHRIEVRSQPGRGSTFTVEVPLAAEAELAATEAEPPSDRAAPSRSGRLALLIEDDAIVILGLRVALGAWGYDTVSADSAEQAQERLADSGRRPDLIVSDYHLKTDRTGIEAIALLRRALDCPVPALIVTGETSGACARDAAQHDIAVVYKPVTPRQLGAALAQLMAD